MHQPRPYGRFGPELNTQDEGFADALMRRAIALAERAAAAGEVPVGALILLDGEIIGDESFLWTDHFDYNATTTTPAKMCRISKAMLFEVIHEHHEALPLVTALIEQLSARLHQANAKIQMLMEGNGLKRVVGFILERDRRLNGAPIQLSLDDIAGSTNLRRETVSRKLTELQKDGLIHRSGHKNLEILDREKLLQLYLET